VPEKGRMMGVPPATKKKTDRINRIKNGFRKENSPFILFILFILSKLFFRAFSLCRRKSCRKFLILMD